MLATSGLRGEITLRRVADGSVERVLLGHTERAVLAFSTDGRRLVAAGDRGTIGLWDLKTGKQLIDTQRELFSSIAFSPDGSLIAVGSVQGRILLFKTDTLALARVIQANTNTTVAASTRLTIHHVAISSDNRLLLSVAVQLEDMSGGIKLWSLPEGRLIRPLVKTAPDGFQYSPDWAVFNPNNPNILTFDDAKILSRFHLNRDGESGKIELAYDTWSLEGRLLPAQPSMAANNLEYRAFGGQAYALSFAVSHDARLVAWGGGVNHHDHYDEMWWLANKNDPRIVVWRLGDPEPTAILIGHEDNVEDLAFSPDNTLLASVSAFDRSLRVWRITD
jgi:WD40 repeat protein